MNHVISIRERINFVANRFNNIGYSTYSRIDETLKNIKRETFRSQSFRFSTRFMERLIRDISFDPFTRAIVSWRDIDFIAN